MERNKLTDLEIGEVSFVDRGAIGEVFSIIKMEDPNNPNPELLKAYNVNQICENLSNMSETDFIAVMNGMMSRYKEINKGGNEMNEEQIKEIVKSVMSETMESVNGNFAKVNKSIDEIQKAVKAQVDAKAQEEADKKAQEDKKVIGCVTKSVEDLTKSVEDINKVLNDVASIKETVSKLAELKVEEKISDITKKLEDIEKMENPSNQPKEDVTKGAAGAPKQIFWKSILGAPETQE